MFSGSMYDPLVWLILYVGVVSMVEQLVAGIDDYRKKGLTKVLNYGTMGNHESRGGFKVSR